MKLVIEYSAGDGYTYSCTNTHPLEYPSAEAFLVEFEDNVKSHALAMQAYRKKEDWDADCPPWHFSLGGHTFHWSDFWFDEDQEVNPPQIMTIDEWFTNNQQ